MTPLLRRCGPADRVGRMLAAVEVNGSGPYRLIIDLGANRSVLSSRLAASPGLASAGTAVHAQQAQGAATVLKPLIPVAEAHARARAASAPATSTATERASAVRCSNNR